MEIIERFTLEGNRPETKLAESISYFNRSFLLDFGLVNPISLEKGGKQRVVWHLNDEVADHFERFVSNSDSGYHLITTVTGYDSIRSLNKALGDTANIAHLLANPSATKILCEAIEEVYLTPQAKQSWGAFKDSLTASKKVTQLVSSRELLPFSFKEFIEEIREHKLPGVTDAATLTDAAKLFYLIYSLVFIYSIRYAYGNFTKVRNSMEFSPEGPQKKDFTKARFVATVKEQFAELMRECESIQSELSIKLQVLATGRPPKLEDYVNRKEILMLTEVDGSLYALGTFKFTAHAFERLPTSNADIDNAEDPSLPSTIDVDTDKSNVRRLVPIFHALKSGEKSEDGKLLTAEAFIEKYCWAITILTARVSLSTLYLGRMANPFSKEIQSDRAWREVTNMVTNSSQAANAKSYKDFAPLQKGTVNIPVSQLGTSFRISLWPNAATYKGKSLTEFRIATHYNLSAVLDDAEKPENNASLLKIRPFMSTSAKPVKRK